MRGGARIALQLCIVAKVGHRLALLCGVALGDTRFDPLKYLSFDKRDLVA